MNDRKHLPTDNANNVESTPAAPIRFHRRRLLAGAAAGLALVPGWRLIEVARASTTEPLQQANPTVRWGLLIDTTRCSSDCTACVSACNQENHLPEATAPTDSQWIRKVELKDKRSGRLASAPVMCQHCADAPCVDVCPTGASMKRADGIVLVDRHACIGCRYCMMACPFKARSFVHAPVTDQNPEVPRGMGCVESCTLCVHRVDRGQLPACVEACPNQAMWFGDLNDPHSAISLQLVLAASIGLRSDLRLDPGVRYQGV